MNKLATQVAGMMIAVLDEINVEGDKIDRKDKEAGQRGTPNSGSLGLTRAYDAVSVCSWLGRRGTRTAARGATTELTASPLLDNDNRSSKRRGSTTRTDQGGQSSS